MARGGVEGGIGGRMTGEMHEGGGEERGRPHPCCLRRPGGRLGCGHGGSQSSLCERQGAPQSQPEADKAPGVCERGGQAAREGRSPLLARRMCRQAGHTCTSAKVGTRWDCCRVHDTMPHLHITIGYSRQTVERTQGRVKSRVHPARRPAAYHVHAHAHVQCPKPHAPHAPRPNTHRQSHTPSVATLTHCPWR